MKKAKDIKLKVRPVAIGVEHQYYYEGPCRFGEGESLQPGFDAFANAQKRSLLEEQLKKFLPEDRFDVLDCVSLGHTDDWKYNNDDWKVVETNMETTDVYVMASCLGADDIALEFYERYRKPMIIPPDCYYAGTVISAAVKARYADAEVYCPDEWDGFAEALEVMRAKKVLQNLTILCAVRFNSVTSMSSVDTLMDHDAITRKIGCHFRYCNIHELMDQMELPTPEGNHCTPGRVTPNVTQEDLEKIGAMADNMIAGAEYTDISREYLINSLKAFVAVRKVMEDKDCNAFSAPCPDSCSTRRLNEQKFTFCMTHSLNMEEGIPSACEYDINAALTQQALIAVSGMNPYMGNTMPLIYKDGYFEPRFMLDPDETAGLEAEPDNLYFTAHAVPNRRMKNPDHQESYAVQHFAHDQKFGAVLRYKFADDAGQEITIARFSPDCSKLLIAKGTVVGGGGYHRDHCNTAIIYRVSDRKEMWKKQSLVGNHLCLVYGDHTSRLKALAEAMGIEPLMVV